MGPPEPALSDATQADPLESPKILKNPPKITGEVETYGSEANQ